MISPLKKKVRPEKEKDALRPLISSGGRKEKGTRNQKRKVYWVDQNLRNFQPCRRKRFLSHGKKGNSLEKRGKARGSISG